MEIVFHNPRTQVSSQRTIFVKWEIMRGDSHWLSPCMFLSLHAMHRSWRTLHVMLRSFTNWALCIPRHGPFLIARLQALYVIAGYPQSSAIRGVGCRASGRFVRLFTRGSLNALHLFIRGQIARARYLLWQLVQEAVLVSNCINVCVIFPQ